MFDEFESSRMYKIRNNIFQGWDDCFCQKAKHHEEKGLKWYYRQWWEYDFSSKQVLLQKIVFIRCGFIKSNIHIGYKRPRRKHKHNRCRIYSAHESWKLHRKHQYRN